MATEVTIRTLWDTPLGKEQLWRRLSARLVRSGDCLLWSGALSGDGYGRIKVNRRLEGAHRVSLAIAQGLSHLPARQAMHRCDRPLCCAPAHLSWGTNEDNVADRVAKHRTRANPLRGTANPNAKLSIESVAEIRLRVRSGASRRGLAREFGVSDRTIRNIEQHVKWADVEACIAKRAEGKA